MTEQQRTWTPVGGQQEVNSDRQRTALAEFDQAYQYAAKSQTHLWVATVAYRLSPNTLDAFDGTSDHLPILDTENLTGPPGIGCYICEQEYEPLLRLRRCPGEPR